MQFMIQENDDTDLVFHSMEPFVVVFVDSTFMFYHIFIDHHSVCEMSFL